MRADLRFEDASLERQFAELQASRGRKLGKQFHLNRAAIWCVVLLRVLASREWPVAAAVVLVLALPAVSHWLPHRLYLGWRTPIKVFDNLLQMGLGCYTHHHLYPSPKSGYPSTFQMAAVLATGSGWLWQCFNSVWNSLSFRVALPQQAALTILLLLYNRTLCRNNLALAPLLALRRHRAAFFAYAAGRDCGATVLAAPPAAREAVRLACMHAMAADAEVQLPRAGLGLVAGAGPEDATELCVSWQPVSQLLLGFLLPTLYIWRTELRQRRAFLAQHVETQVARGRAPPRREAVPTLIEYSMFAAPAVLCMWSLVAVHA
ncbi:expressed protein [Chlorella variabilis]|uniref:Expressed protein n=1 Tax=Chlorella variabilis TaxID=554065 RepID=E1ZF57_CHLVA|nr:expressed protein [Chlorella variabilis]EFN55611.1 expressed protein [Chlorella variabilis]|eukprot:XP_005847713.1 expressed protein [Chlorella variabilis]